MRLDDHNVLNLYHAYGEYEQFHSEIETDMNLKLVIITFKILRMIGQEFISRRGTETKHKVRRRCLRMVIRNMIMTTSP